MIKILIADDHTLVRRGIKQILAGTQDMAVIDEAANGEEALTKAVKNDYDVILLDIRMPKKDGISVLEEIQKVKPNLPVLMLSMHPEDEFAKETLRKGASGYVTKESAPEELIDAIRKVHSGSRYLSSAFAENLVSNIDLSEQKPIHTKLSSREFEVLKLLSSGQTLKQISTTLSLSAKTISSYRMNMMKKMKMKTNAELITYAVKHRLVE